MAEASRRFAIPEDWIWSVMRVESAGVPSATSRAGAVGLMQVMPSTYTEMRVRHALGPDAYQPRDNILAGAAYLRAMLDRYGPSGMLAAYNAGPKRWEDHVTAARPLPAETVRYMQRLGPLVGSPLPGHTVPAEPTPASAPIFVALSTSLRDGREQDRRRAFSERTRPLDQTFADQTSANVSASRFSATAPHPVQRSSTAQPDSLFPPRTFAGGTP